MLEKRGLGSLFAADDIRARLQPARILAPRVIWQPIFWDAAGLVSRAVAKTYSEGTGSSSSTVGRKVGQTRCGGLEHGKEDLRNAPLSYSTKTWRGDEFGDTSETNVFLVVDGLRVSKTFLTAGVALI